jgi:hypothetical protein
MYCNANFALKNRTCLTFFKEHFILLDRPLFFIVQKLQDDMYWNAGFALKNQMCHTFFKDIFFIIMVDFTNDI